MEEKRIIRTKEDFIKLSGKVDISKEMKEFEGMDLIRFMNEYDRIMERAKLTNVKTYSYKFDAPRFYNYHIGYVVDLHEVQLKINKNWLDAGQDEEWWMQRIQKMKDSIALWVKQILYMNAYEERERRLAEMRNELDKKGIRYIDDEEYQAEWRKPIKYEE